MKTRLMSLCLLLTACERGVEYREGIDLSTLEFNYFSPTMGVHPDDVVLDDPHNLFASGMTSARPFLVPPPAFPSEAFPPIAPDGVSPRQPHSPKPFFWVATGRVGGRACVSSFQVSTRGPAPASPPPPAAPRPPPCQHGACSRCGSGGPTVRR